MGKICATMLRIWLLFSFKQQQVGYDLETFQFGLNYGTVEKFKFGPVIRSFAKFETF